MGTLLCTEIVKSINGIISVYLSIKYIFEAVGIGKRVTWKWYPKTQNWKSKKLFWDRCRNFITCCFTLKIEKMTGLKNVRLPRGTVEQIFVWLCIKPLFFRGDLFSSVELIEKQFGLVGLIKNKVENRLNIYWQQTAIVLWNGVVEWFRKQLNG